MSARLRVYIVLKLSQTVPSTSPSRNIHGIISMINYGTGRYYYAAWNRFIFMDAMKICADVLHAFINEILAVPID